MTEPKVVKLPKISDPRGNLSVIEEFKDIPFKIERTYWIYDVPGGENRGGHAYKENQEFIVALSGSFDVVLVVWVCLCDAFCHRSRPFHLFHVYAFVGELSGREKNQA